MEVSDFVHNLGKEYVEIFLILTKAFDILNHASLQINWKKLASSLVT